MNVKSIFEKEEPNIEEYVFVIKKRWGMFLLKRQVDYLYHFLLGKSFTEYIIYEDNLMNKVFWKYFHDYCKNYIKKNRNVLEYQLKSSNWSDEIRKVCHDEDEAMELFFEIFDDFIRDFHNGQFIEI